MKIHNLNHKLPIDPHVKIDRLPNGLTYYIRENQSPARRLELRLIINAGSVLEADDEQGFFHIIEHLAFKNTRNFPDQSLVHYLESIGVVYGTGVNAYTRFDETLYALQVPSDNEEIIRQSFQIMEDWAHQIIFDPKIIETERAVILEEERLHYTESRLMCEKVHKQVLMGNSRYIKRFPIGDREIIRNCKADDLATFYRKWYRPELMAVVAVGDISSSAVEQLIQTFLGRVPGWRAASLRDEYSLPAHRETRFSIVTHPEIITASVQIHYKHSLEPLETLANYRHLLMDILAKYIMNKRLSEQILTNPTTPLIDAAWYRKRLTRQNQSTLIQAAIAGSRIMEGLEALLTMICQATQHGFTATELERQKRNILREFEHELSERDKRLSAGFAMEYENHFLRRQPIPGLDDEYTLHRDLLATIRLQELNDFFRSKMGADNRVILISAPRTPGMEVPEQFELIKTLARIEQKKFPLYAEESPNPVLMTRKPTPGQIAAQRPLPGLGITEWTLTNGTRIVLKPTTFQNDQILFIAYHAGGHSLASDLDYISAVHSPSIMGLSGFGEYPFLSLQKKLSGKVAKITPFVNPTFHGISGSCSPLDTETMFQLMYLGFTAPRRDPAALAAYKNRLLASLENKKANPEAVFWDELQITLTQNHFRARPLNLAMAVGIELDPAFNFYEKRFADAAGFTFIFVGNFTEETLAQPVIDYCGALPGHHNRDTWQDQRISYVTGKVNRTIRMGQERKSLFAMAYSGSFEWCLDNHHALQSLAGVLQIQLREKLREEAGSIYMIDVMANAEQFPRPGYVIYLTMGCDPDRVPRISATIHQTVDSLRQGMIDEKYVSRVRETQRRAREVGLRSNNFWLNELFFFYFNTGQPQSLIDWGVFIENLTPEKITRAANYFLNTNNCVTVTLCPDY